MSISQTEWSSTGAGEYRARLSGGSFQFQLETEDLPFPEICDVAIRDNARRRFLFVSRVLGRHWPVRPAVLKDIAVRLVEKVSTHGEETTVFIGMAETATTLGQAVFREWRRSGRDGFYIESTRRPTGGEVAFQFSESHSHATAHLIHRPGFEEDPNGLLQHASRVVVVDDEATTAATAEGLIRALRAWRADMPFLARLAVIVRWKADAGSSGDLVGIESLAEGRFTFAADDCDSAAPPACHEPDRVVNARRGARHGTCEAEALPKHWNASARAGERVLVLGNGEHGFRPLLLAEALEANGAKAWVQATTRSPILLGGAIGHKRQFPALSGEEHMEYLYNVPDQHQYNRIILCTEDLPPPLDHPIWLIPALEVCA